MGRIIAVSDIHGSLTALYKLKAYIISENISDFILLGDYSASIGNIEENRDDIKAIVNNIGDLANVYALPGNCDALDVAKVLRSFGIYYHNKAMRIADYTVLFYGGANPTPFNTPWEVDEEIMYKDIKALFEGHPQGPKLLALHAPPRDTACDRIPDGRHVGSVSVRRVIEEYGPELVICGHIHECAGRTDTIGASRIINIGRLGEGHFLEISAEGFEHKRLKLTMTDS